MSNETKTMKPKLDLNTFVVATFDIETDPFKSGRKPEPFSFGFYNGEQSFEIVTAHPSDEDKKFLEHWETLSKEEKRELNNKKRTVNRRIAKTRTREEKVIAEKYVDFWSEDPAEVKEQFIEHLETLDTPHLIFAHNGGKFDYMFFHKYIRGSAFVINGRLVEWTYTTRNGVTHVLRDSYAILPISLGSGGNKLDIDYRKMEKAVRLNHKEEILIYLKQDCVALYDLCLAFKNKFGKWFMTLASASYSRIKERYSIENTYNEFDTEFRQYYFGGRCQAFQSGEIRGDIEVYDVNSMYPYAMSEFIHPLSKHYYTDDTINEEETFFIKWRGINKGALPVRLPNGSINFDQEEGVFFSSIHEYRVALKYDLIIVDEIIETHNWVTFGNFKEHIDICKEAKETAEKGSNAYILAKLEMNSGYGKFAQDCRKYKDYEFADPETISDNPNATILENNEFTLICTPSEGIERFNNVAIAASITGASRAMMLEALIEFKRAGAVIYYCDTDSVICSKPKRDVEKLNFHPTRLGAWDKEKTGDLIYIGGKKIYSLFDKGDCVKIASKGVRVVPRDIYEFLPANPTPADIKEAKRIMENIGGNEIKNVALGGTFNFKNDAPSLKLDGEHLFIERNMRLTFTKPTLLEN